MFVRVFHYDCTQDMYDWGTKFLHFHWAVDEIWRQATPSCLVYRLQELFIWLHEQESVLVQWSVCDEEGDGRRLLLFLLCHGGYIINHEEYHIERQMSIRELSLVAFLTGGGGDHDLGQWEFFVSFIMTIFRRYDIMLHEPVWLQKLSPQYYQNTTQQEQAYMRWSMKEEYNHDRLKEERWDHLQSNRW